MDSTTAAVVSLFREHRKFVLTTHVNPDGDGLGSEIALAEWLVSSGKQAHVINYSTTPDIYRFLDPNKRLLTFDETQHAAVIADAEVIVVLDSNHPGRLRTMEPHVLKSNATRICIDHHLEPAPFADHYLIDDDATSTGEIVYKLLLELNGKDLSPLVAQGLYCAIMTDTGSFRYPRVDPETFRTCAHLIQCGADPVAIYHHVYEQWSAGRIQLLGIMLEMLETLYDGRLAHVCITQDMLHKTGTKEEDTDNFTTYPMSIGGVQVGILFLELTNGVKISFRSKGDIPVNELAKEYGGNGHKNAAGARVHDVTLDAIRRRVLHSSEKYLQPTPKNA